MANQSRPADELAHDSIGFVDALVIGLNATSPAYSLAAVIGPIVALVQSGRPGWASGRRWSSVSRSSPPA